MIARVSADFLVIGSGIAGLRAAIELAPHGRVLVLTKADPGAGNTSYAQGGIAAVVGPDDDVAQHVADTVRAGDGLCDLDAVQVLVADGERAVRELVDWGAEFDRRPDGTLDLAREGAHSVRRVLHARDATGREIARVLAERLKDLSTITVIDHALAVQALVKDDAVAGVRFVDRYGQLVEAHAATTLLATGGAGQIYRDTTNPPVATGDGVALAYLAGARVADLEFVQFHPTVLAVAGAPRYLLSEALRGEGAKLVNEAGDPFMHRYEPDGELASRDRVARAMVLEAERTHAPVYLSLAHLSPALVRERFPAVAELCRRVGLDLATDRVPVGPAAHYLIGGVVTDLEGRTSLPGLFAAGEVARTGVHGANRLASNSLLEGLVFGASAGRAMRGWRRGGWPDPTASRSDPPPAGARAALAFSEADVRDEMWRYVGVFRDHDDLAGVGQMLAQPWNEVLTAVTRGLSFDAATWRRAAIVTVARLVVEAARRRTESRGAHWRTDFPERNDLDWNRSVSEVRSEK